MIRSSRVLIAPDRTRRRLAMVVAAALAGLALPTVPVAAQAAVTEAPGGPGVASYQGQSRKDCVGTARNTTSKIWFTIANGVLSDVYAPTVDTTNVQNLQYLVTDGSTFTDLQTRDTTYTAVGDPTGMLCTVTTTAKSGRYKLVSTYLTDPARSSVIVRTQYVPLTSAAKAYRLFVRLDAGVGGTGGGGTGNIGGDSAVVDTSTGSAVPVSFDRQNNSDHAYSVPSYLALRADQPFGAVSSGFSGTSSDGLTQLDTTRTLAPTYSTATGGNVEQTAAVTPDARGNLTLALGFGTSQAAAVQTAGNTLAAPLARTVASYLAGWAAYDAKLRRPTAQLPGLTNAQRLTAVKGYYQAANVVKASEDKTFPGAIVAGLDAPWGQSISGFSTGYRQVFARDLYEAWTALYTDGDLATARDTVRYLLLKSQQANGSQPRNSTLDGSKAPDAFNDQLDETAYPILMALQSGLGSDPALWPRIQKSANFLISRGPSFGVERWEEQTGYSPSTIAAEIAGLVAAARIAELNNSPADARTWLATADEYQRSIKKWGVTTTGALSDSPYFIRLSKTGDPDAAIVYNQGNGGPDLDQRNVVDLGFLEYVRLGILPAIDPVLPNSLTVADALLKKQTDNGPGWLRYNGDGYGDCFVDADHQCGINGAPWTDNFRGNGHPWPVLGVERAQQYLALGQNATAGSLLATVNRMNSGPGLVPEQVWEYPDLPASPYGTDPATASIGFVNGESVGSASPLTWGSGAQVRLTADLSAGRSLEQPAEVRNRYVTRSQGTTPLTVTSPADLTSVESTFTVSGTAAPGARIDIADVAVEGNSATTHTSGTAGADGSFSFEITSQAGTNVLVISSTATNGGTAQTVRTVVSDVVDGTLIYRQADLAGDDNGPGNYAYPTSSNFKPGAFDLTNFEVYDTGSTVTFRVQTRDLTATFGATNGAQLVDVYIHNPGATATSTAASFASRNHTIAAAGAWSRLVEVQGFGNNKFVDAAGASVGTVNPTANSITRYITFSVDKAALGGTPGAGWGFVVTLTGQDGFSSDQARGFGATPGEYSFGVCAAGASGPLCSVDPGAVPKVVDTITPAGTAQSDELNYVAQNPVVLQPIVVP